MSPFPQFSLLSRRALVLTTFALLPFTGAIYLAHAQTSEENRVAAQRVLNAQRAEMRPEGRYGDGHRGDGVITSPDRNFVVMDLGEANNNVYKARSHAVYDFAAKKVFIVRFTPDSNSVAVESRDLR
jgi:hypothetical protein